MKTEELRIKLNQICTALLKARTKAECDLIELIKEEGGLFKLYPKESNNNDCVRVYKTYGSDDIFDVLVYGLRVSDENELTLCTSDTLENYEYDNGVSFKFDNSEEDIKLFEDMLSKPEYFEDFNGDFVKGYSLTNLLFLIGLYI